MKSERALAFADRKTTETKTTDMDLKTDLKTADGAQHTTKKPNKHHATTEADAQALLDAGFTPRIRIDWEANGDSGLPAGISIPAFSAAVKQPSAKLLRLARDGLPALQQADFDSALSESRTTLDTARQAANHKRSYAAMMAQARSVLVSSGELPSELPADEPARRSWFSFGSA